MVLHVLLNAHLTSVADHILQDTLHGAARLVTSRGIQRTALNLALLVTASLSLLGMALLATGLFFQNYLPDQVIETPLFLQYG